MAVLTRGVAGMGIRRPVVWLDRSSVIHGNIKNSSKWTAGEPNQTHKGSASGGLSVPDAIHYRDEHPAPDVSEGYG
jgi:hypothetical protein